jgi:hypothetical protein
MDIKLKNHNACLFFTPPPPHTHRDRERERERFRINYASTSTLKGLWVILSLNFYSFSETMIPLIQLKKKLIY